MYTWCYNNFVGVAPDHSMVTTQPAEFMDYVESFSAFGGGDCKERMLAALLKASDMSCPRSTIYVFSDASPKDLDLLGSVLSRLQEKKQQVQSWGVDYLFPTIGNTDKPFLTAPIATALKCPDMGGIRFRESDTKCTSCAMHFVPSGL